VTITHVAASTCESKLKRNIPRAALALADFIGRL
jgi:hypothetical protein